MLKHFTSIVLSVVLCHWAFAQTRPSAPQELAQCIDRMISIVEPPPGSPPKAFSTTIRITAAENLPKFLADAKADLLIQPPDRVRISFRAGSTAYDAGRNGQSIWIYAPAKHFGVIGTNDVARFAADPNSFDRTPLEPLAFFLNRQLVRAVLVALDARFIADDALAVNGCSLIEVKPSAPLTALLRLPDCTIQLVIRDRDSLPMQLRFASGKIKLEATFENSNFADAMPADRWELRRARRSR